MMKKLILLALLFSTQILAEPIILSLEDLPDDSGGYSFEEVMHEDMQHIRRYFDELHAPPKKLKKKIKVFKELKYISDRNKIDHKHQNLQRKFETTFKSYSLKTETFKAMLKKGSAVYSPKENKYFRTNYDIIINTRMNSENATFVELLNKDGEVRFQTRYENIVPMEQDLEIRPVPSQFTLYDKCEKTWARDDQLPLYTKFMLHQEISSDGFFAEVLEQDIEKIENTRFEIKPMYILYGYNLHIGMSGGLLKGRISAEDETMDFSSFFLGPAIEFNFFKGENHSFSSGMAFQKSINFSVETTNGNHDYSQDIVQFNFDYRHKIKSGDVVLGIIYKFIKSTYAGDINDFVNETPEKKSYYSVGFSLGYGFKALL